jgi:polyribonucleotide nucleotidyltransferase
MDIKTPGITKDIIKHALTHSKEACLKVLQHMEETIAEPRKDLSKYAPRIVTIQIKPERIKDVIGPGGRTIRDIIEKTGVRIDIEDSGKVNIASQDKESSRRAIQFIESLTQEAEVGKLCRGVVKRITNYGAFVEIFPGTDGLIHISQLAKERVHNVSDVLSEGDQVLVKIIEVDRQGRIKLSRKEALDEQERINVDTPDEQAGS